MRVVFAGTPDPAVPSLTRIAHSEHQLVGVVTRPDAPAGRGRRLTACPVAQAAADLGLPLLQPQHPRDPEFQAQLRALNPDVCAVVAYGAILPESALSIPRLGWINLHFSVLPAWRGAAPVQRAIWAGDDFSGATTFRIVRELDAGPVLGVMTEVIRPIDTAGSLLSRLADAGAGLLRDTLSGLARGELEARPQTDDGVSFAPKLEVAEAQLDWNKPAVLLERQIRACWPAPGAWTLWSGERFKIGPGAKVVAATLAPGELQVTSHEVIIGTGVGCLQLGEVKPFGKRLMSAIAWARGDTRVKGGRFE
jgi:methionyl-tRNA formyltransferase